MATCPECGGRLFPVRPAALVLPREGVCCRWCRALLRLPWTWRAAWLGALVLALAAAAYAAFRVPAGPARLLWLAGLAAGVPLAAWLAGSCLPLATVRPRDYREWTVEEGEAEAAAGREAS
ncbi:MAG: hypothetical protein D6718_12845 [Acidobacteria bacterium]|nr:MAG: hypothetical protein D6718_12845 [Acidobacteriota bacterium]